MKYYLIKYLPNILSNVLKFLKISYTFPFKGYLCCKTIHCHKVAIDMQLMNFFI